MFECLPLLQRSLYSCSKPTRYPLNLSSLTWDEIMEPRSVFGRVCYQRARLVAAFLVDSNRLPRVKTNENFFGGAWGIYIRRSDTPAIWDRFQTTWLQLESLRWI